MKKRCYDYEIVSKNPIAWLYNHDDTVKKVKIIGCDFNKYVDMICMETGEEWSYKWGYVYPTEEDAHKAIANTKAWLADEAEYKSVDCINPWKLLLIRRVDMFKKKLKVRISAGFKSYHLHWTYYRIFPDWKEVKIYYGNINMIGGYCASLKEATDLAKSLDSYRKLQKWNKSQEVQVKKVGLDAIEEVLPSHIVKD